MTEEDDADRRRRPVRRVLRGAVPAQQRAVVVLRYWEGMSVEQTAALLRMAPGTVKSQAARGLAALREHVVPR